MDIIEQWVKTNEETLMAALFTKYADGSIKGEPISIQEAAEWTARNKF